MTLKQRSGLSYERLAHRTFTTRSTLHRYCTGASVPADYAIVAAVARECGATSVELSALAEYWTAAVTETPDTGEPAPSPEAARTRHWWESSRARLAVFAVTCVGVLGAIDDQVAAVRGTAGAPAASAVSGGPGDRWLSAPSPEGPASFGVSMDTGTTPSIKIASVRFSGEGTRWSDLEPRRGEFDWGHLDGMVAEAGRADRSVLFTVGGTPGWAAPGGKKSPYVGGSRTAPADDLADWDAFVRALAHRYRGRIGAYELWETANDPRFYSGSVGTLVDMVRRASGIIRTEAPGATVVCPSMGRLRESSRLSFLLRFARLGGYQYCDVAGLQTRQRPADEPPETMASELATVDSKLHAAGVSMQYWDTGPALDVRGRPKVSSDQARDYAARLFLLGLYGRKLDLSRVYFYNWGGDQGVPIVLQIEHQAPTAAARAVDRLQRWLDGARIGGCGHGPAMGLPGNVWQCRFLRGGQDMVIRWAAHGTAATPAGGDAVYRLDGSSTRVRPGTQLRVTGAPVLITVR